MGFFLKNLIPRIPSRRYGISILSLYSISCACSQHSLPSIHSHPTIFQSPFHTLQITKKPNPPLTIRSLGSQAIVVPQTSDGLTVDGIAARSWPILDESESDWKSHAAAIAQSIQLIKKRLQVKMGRHLLNGVDSQWVPPDSSLHAYYMCYMRTAFWLLKAFAWKTLPIYPSFWGIALPMMVPSRSMV